MDDKGTNLIERLLEYYPLHDETHQIDKFNSKSGTNENHSSAEPINKCHFFLLRISSDAAQLKPNQCNHLKREINNTC